MSLFQKGQQKLGGRVKGTRNKLSGAFLEAMLKEFEQFGEKTIRIARIEDPVTWLKIMAAILPKEFEIVAESRLTEISDEELNAYIEYAEREVARRDRSAEGGKETALN